MNTPTLVPILADLESFLTGTFMVIAFIGWIINLSSQKKPVPPPRRPQGAPPPQKNLQSEIEQFLEQTRSKPPASSDPFPSSDGVEVIERPRPQPVRRAPPATQRRRSQKDIREEQIRPAPPQKLSPPRPKKQPRPNETGRQQGSAPSSGSPLAGKAFPAQGQVLTPRFEPLSASKVGALATQGVRGALATNVAPQLGGLGAYSGESTGESGISSTLSHRQSAAQRLAKMMRSRNNVRDAILLSEIMSRPRALNRRDS